MPAAKGFQKQYGPSFNAVEAEQVGRQIAPQMPAPGVQAPAPGSR
jgi:hypothetical protein